jgi:hypothetical protein
MRISKHNLQQIIKEETTLVLREKRWKGIKLTPEKKWPQQIKDQISYLENRFFNIVDQNFVIIDDKNRKLYVFSEDFKLLANVPIISGRDSGEEDILKMEEWLKENGTFGYYTDMLQKIAAGGPEAKIALREKEKMFEWFLEYASAQAQRVTPSGVFTLAKLKKDPADRINYGTRKYSLRPGADAFSFVPVSGIAMHGTGNKARIPNLKKAARKMKNNPTVDIQPIVVKRSSFGCVNVQNKFLEGLDELVGIDSLVFILPEDGSIVEVGTFENLGHYLDRVADLGGECIDMIRGRRHTSDEVAKKVQRSKKPTRKQMRAANRAGIRLKRKRKRAQKKG